MVSKENFGFKVQLFWESHNNLRNLPHGFEIYLSSKRRNHNQIPQIFVAFSEKLNFIKTIVSKVYIDLKSANLVKLAMFIVIMQC